MHDTAMEFGRLFFDGYIGARSGLTIVDIGGRDVNGSLRSVAPAGNRYLAVDFTPGDGVDIVITDPYVLPFEDATVDVVVSSSCFEHAEFFWLLFNECLRVLRPEGLLYINAPSNGAFHRYPVDCWRFYPDSGIALQNWGRRSGYNCALLESFVGPRKQDIWNDFVAVFLKDESCIALHPRRLQDVVANLMNGRRHGSETIANPVEASQDQAAHAKLLRLQQAFRHIVEG
jgi:SAM-dependent methyltransferase